MLTSAYKFLSAVSALSAASRGPLPLARFFARRGAIRGLMRLFRSVGL